MTQLGPVPEPLQIQEEYVGDGEDGCYVYLYELANGKYEVEVVVDCETSHFRDTLQKLGPYDDEGDAMIDGRGAAAEWCIINGVDFEPNE